MPLLPTGLGLDMSTACKLHPAGHMQAVLHTQLLLGRLRPCVCATVLLPAAKHDRAAPLERACAVQSLVCTCVCAASCSDVCMCFELCVSSSIASSLSLSKGRLPVTRIHLSSVHTPHVKQLSQLTTETLVAALNRSQTQLHRT
jgi:hypothetical protein